MPHIRIRGLQNEEVRGLSRTLLARCAEVVGCPEDWFTLEAAPTSFFFGGQEVKGGPIVECWWFHRPQVLCDRVAALITDVLRPLAEDRNVVVIFVTMEKTAYYEDGKHFGLDATHESPKAWT